VVNEQVAVRVHDLDIRVNKILISENTMVTFAHSFNKQNNDNTKLIFIPLLFILFFLAGCSNDTKNVLEEIKKYHSQVKEIASLEEDAFAEGMNINFKNKEEAVLKISKGVQKYTEYINKLSQIKPADSEFQSIHNKIISASGKQLESLKLFQLSVEQNDKEANLKSAEMMKEAAAGLKSVIEGELQQYFNSVAERYKNENRNSTLLILIGMSLALLSLITGLIIVRRKRRKQRRKI